MTHATLYPLADARVQWFADDYPGIVFSGMEKVLWHSTEGSGWPAYSGGSIAPNLTCMPDVANKRLIWRQHFPTNMSSRALVHTRTQPTNGDHVVQIECIGTCVPGGPGLYWPDAPSWALDGLAEFAAWMYREWSVPLQSTVAWRGYADPGDWQRLTDAEYNAYVGHLAHEHAPQNDHRDIGALPMSTVMSMAASKITGGQVTPDEINAIADATVSKLLLARPAGSDLNVQTILARNYPQEALNTQLVQQLQATVNSLAAAVAKADANDADPVDTDKLATDLAALLNAAPAVDAAAVADSVVEKIGKRMSE